MDPLRKLNPAFVRATELQVEALDKLITMLEHGGGQRCQGMVHWMITDLSSMTDVMPWLQGKVAEFGFRYASHAFCDQKPPVEKYLVRRGVRPSIGSACPKSSISESEAASILQGFESRIENGIPRIDSDENMILIGERIYNIHAIAKGFRVNLPECEFKPAIRVRVDLLAQSIVMAESRAGCLTKRLRYIAEQIADPIGVSLTQIVSSMMRQRKEQTHIGRLERTGQSRWELTMRGSIFELRAFWYLDALELVGIQAIQESS